VIFGAAMLFGIQIFILGPMFARQDLRNDLENADVIKTWPLEGWQIVLGELLAPVLILTVIMWLCLLELFLGIAFLPRKADWITPEFRFLAGSSLALVLPFLIAFQLFMANATVVLFPAWAKNSGLQYQGLEVAGQRLLFFAAQLVALLAVLLPALLFGLLVFIPAQWFLDTYAMLPAAIVAAVVLAGELAWGINWLGERFDAYDLTA
jgi:ABC-2 type transport system permease protein